MKKGLLIGCGVLLLIMTAIIGMIIIAGPGLFESGKEWVGKQWSGIREMSAIEQNWHPPGAILGQEWFPKQVADWQRTDVAAPVTLPEVSSRSLSGGSARYQTIGGRVVKVTIVPVPAAEKDAVIKEIEEALKNGGKTTTTRSHNNFSITTTTSVSHRMTRVQDRVHLVMNGDEHTRLWWIKDWLFMFQSQGGEDPEDFAVLFLANSSESAPVVADPAPAPTADQ